MKRVYPIESRCIGCRLCEVACVAAHSKTKDLLNAFQMEGLVFNNERSRGYVDPGDAHKADRPQSTARCSVSPSQPYRISIRCRHCDDAPCLLACKNGAIYKDEQGRVLVQEDKCAGCWMCIMACPSGSIRRNPLRGNIPGVENNGVNLHCDLCAGLGMDTTACVQVCPVTALVFEDRDQSAPQVCHQQLETAKTH